MNEKKSESKKSEYTLEITGLCSNCKVGMYYVQLDPSEVECPHIKVYKNSKCFFYRPIKE